MARRGGTTPCHIVTVLPMTLLLQQNVIILNALVLPIYHIDYSAGLPTRNAQVTNLSKPHCCTLNVSPALFDLGRRLLLLLWGTIVCKTYGRDETLKFNTSPIFTDNIWSCSLWSPVIIVTHFWLDLLV